MGHFWSDGVCLFKKPLPALLEMAGLLREFIPCFALCVCVAFVFPVKLSFSQATGFPDFTLLISSPFLVQWEWASGYIGLGCWLGINPDTVQVIKKKKKILLFIQHIQSPVCTKTSPVKLHGLSNRQQGNHGLPYPDPTLLRICLCCWKEMKAKYFCLQKLL